MVYTQVGLGYETPGMVLTATPITGNERLAVDTELANGISPQTAALTTGMLATYLSGYPSWVTGRFYGVPTSSTQAAVITVTATLYAYPIYIPNQVAISTFNVSTTTGQTGAAAHVGIYADNGAGYPGALVYDTGAFNLATSSNAINTNTPTTPVALNPGLYWVATIFTATGTFPSVAGSTAIYGSALNALLGSDTAAHSLAVSGGAATGISVAGTYGALPSTFTAGATLTLSASTPVISLGV